MNNIYVDATFDKQSGYGNYCIVIDKDGTPPQWTLGDFMRGQNSNEFETAGLQHAIDLATKLAGSSIIYSDSLTALHNLRLTAKRHAIGLRHIKGHQDVTSRHIKMHHWADTMARGQLRQFLRKLPVDNRKTGA